LEGKRTDKYLSFNADEYKYYELDTNEEILPQYLIRGHNYVFKRITKLIGTFRYKLKSEPTITFNNIRLTDGTELYPLNDTLIRQRYKNFGVPFDINSCEIYEVKKFQIENRFNKDVYKDVLNKLHRENTLTGEQDNESLGYNEFIMSHDMFGEYSNEGRGYKRKSYRKSYRKTNRKTYRKNKSRKLKQYK
jgi:hypothetical protein